MMLVKRAPPRQEMGGSSDTGAAQDEEKMQEFPQVATVSR